MKHKRPFLSIPLTLMAFAVMISVSSCEEEDTGDATIGASAVLLVIDEESIDNGGEPNYFETVDVNDHLADLGLRQQLTYFQNHVGDTIDLYTGQVGDEGWFALKTIVDTWKNAGPTANGSDNFLAAGPGLGGPLDGMDDDEHLDNIPDVTPLRAKGLAMLTGQTVIAVVYDSDISINYSPLEGNLSGNNLGMVAFKVLGTAKRTNGSSSSLPIVTVRILDVTAVSALPLVLFTNAPIPSSSSEPFDVTPPAPIPAAITSPAP
jgi:hypothetical protein